LQSLTFIGKQSYRKPALNTQQNTWAIQMEKRTFHKFGTIKWLFFLFFIFIIAFLQTET